jgi:alcohol dehydrogenase class IV
MNPLNPFDFHQSTRVVFGLNSIDQLGELASELGAKRVLLVTDHGIVSAGHADRAVQSLQRSGVSTAIFNGVHENPTTQHVEEGVRFAGEHGPVDFIVALGGGSAMDCAKGINFLLTNGGKMENYWGADKAAKPMLPSIGIPTTAGTGSEAQSYALISQSNTHIKMACGDKKARFHLVILDPSVTVTMPRSVTAVTGIDAIAHAIESYVTTAANPLSRMFSSEAWRLLEHNFEVALNEPTNLDARSNMLLGSHFAGVAIEFSMLGAAHACANPLTTHYDVLHGIAVGLMLPHVIRFNAPVAESYYEELIRISGNSGGADQLSERIMKLKGIASLPQSLKDCRVDRRMIGKLAREAASQWTGKFNPREVNEQEFVQLYESAF